MKYVIAAMLLSISSFTLANVFVGSGIVPKDNNTALVIHMGWEGKEKHPWTFAYTFVDKYNTTNHVVESHYTISGGKQWTYTLVPGWDVYGEFGLALFNKKTRVSPMNIAFYESVGVKYNRYRLFFRHTSNANIKKPNVGENILMFAISF